jgi:heme/copper-type cytochrome/quinol oxidase subunit 2
MKTITRQNAKKILAHVAVRVIQITASVLMVCLLSWALFTVYDAVRENRWNTGNEEHKVPLGLALIVCAFTVVIGIVCIALFLFEIYDKLLEIAGMKRN